ncbi:MAG: hypothetical protein JO208_01090 [Alphaproteobacteria bacterium]|nr:hypothetical protein [Alphaproteobacteria bacterium]
MKNSSRLEKQIRSAGRRLRATGLRIAGSWAGRAAIAEPDRTAGPGRALAADAVRIDPARAFQPDHAFVEAYSRFDEADAENFERVNDNLVLYRNIPYSKYLGVWQFHPGRIGGYLTTRKLTPKLIRTAKSLLDYMVELPNGGLALYYPPTLDVTRFLTRERLYSGIAQGQLLAGFARLAAQDPNEKRRARWRDVAARIAASLEFPLEDGGVCVDGRMILEAPNFHACPESILNGWVDALLHLHDYVAEDSALCEFYGRNVAAVAELLPTFDDPGARLSRYSNLCRYVARVHVARSGPKPKVALEYLAKAPGFLDRYNPDLWDAPEPNACPYDNGVLHRSGSTLDLSVSISGQYDLRIAVAADCRAISFDPGAVTVTASSPVPTGRRFAISPAIPYDGTNTVFLIDSSQHELIPGYPTNFAKNGHQNFYHSYHVAALYELALTVEEPELRRCFADWAERWLAYMKDPVHTGRRDYVFIDPGHFARSIGNFRANKQPHSFTDLRTRANEGN